MLHQQGAHLNQWLDPGKSSILFIVSMPPLLPAWRPTQLVRANLKYFYHVYRVFGISGMEWWNGMLEWNAGMEYWNGMVEWNSDLKIKYYSLGKIWSEKIFVESQV